MAKKRRDYMHPGSEGILIPAGLFLGLGIGGFAGNWGAGVLFGLGMGFLIMAIIRLNRKK